MNGAIILKPNWNMRISRLLQKCTAGIISLVNFPAQSNFSAFLVPGHSCTCLLGQPSLRDPPHCHKPNNCTRPLSKAQQDNHHRKSFASLEVARVEEEDLKQESSATFIELFHGFLAIGTLGADPVFTEPSTSTFGISIENIAEKETEVTENELKLINDELEKVLGAESKDDGCNDAPCRSSHVSTWRSSHGSTITFGGKPMEGTENNENGAVICPLQGYLFGSAVGLPETTATEKREHRASLGELFQKTKIAEEIGAKCDRGEKPTEKEADKSGVHLMKKILKRKMLHVSYRSSTAPSGGTVDSAWAETKLHKMLHIFQRKVHPESSTASQKSDKPQKNKVKSNITNDSRYNRDSMPTGEDIIKLTQRTLPKGRMRRFKSQCNPPQVALKAFESHGNKECWIRSDADYLVLELWKAEKTP